MNNDQTVPREAITGIATGSILMAVFTTCWAILANNGYHGRDHHFTEIIFFALAALFIRNAFKLFNAAKQFLPSTSAADIAEKKRTGKWFGIIFGLEGITIPIAVNIVIAYHHPELIIPVIALIVGLHFYPMAHVFKRKIDYYLATWTCIIAIVGIIFSLKRLVPESNVLAFVGTGLAIATASYGIFMILNGRRLMQET